MSYRVINAFSLDQRNFKTVTSGDVYSWGFSGAGNGNDLIRPLNIPLYRTYLPTDPVPYSLRSVLVQAINSGAVAGTDVNDVVFVSPLIDVVEHKFYSFSISALAVSGNITFTFDAEFFEEDTVTLVSNPVSSFDVDALESNLVFLMNFFQIPEGVTKARLKVTVGGYKTAPLKNFNGCAFFDPVICDITPSNISFFSETVYSSLPGFMQIDDEKINEILSPSSFQMVYPLRRYIESLCAVADKIYLQLDEFRYDRAVDTDDGVEYKSKLTDPDTAPEEYLPWLASITGSKLFSISTGLTPWVALESYDGDSDGIPGEWDDIEEVGSWRALETLNPNLFDSTQGYRDQIRTGATGLNAGRPDSIVELIRTMLDSDTRDTDIVVLSNEYTDNPFRVKLFVDPASDPDPAGSLLPSVASRILSVGSSVVKESQVLDSGRGSYRLEDAFYPNTFTDENAAGSAIYGQSFISDYEFSGQNIVLNTFYETDSQPELGGGVGAAHYSENSAYYFGWDGASFTSLTSVDAVTSLGGRANYDIISVLTDVVVPIADVYTGTGAAASPPDYLFNEKRLIACGTDDTNSGNDWALYIVSGLTPSPDNNSRLLFIDGYRTRNNTNYAYSDPIDPSLFAQHKEVCIRFRKEGTNFKFYIQNSLYDDWETHIVGSGSFTPTSTSSGGNHGVQILGELNTSNDWSDAGALACAVKRVMIFNDVISFENENSVSAAAHAVCDGGGVEDYGSYIYTPTVDIDLSNVSLYAQCFSAVTYSNFSYGSIEVSVNSASPASEDAWIDCHGLRLPGIVGNYASTPDSSVLDISGDMEIVVRAKATDWTPTSVQAFVSKWTGGLTQRSYALQLSTSGQLLLSICDGVTNFSVASSTAFPGLNDTIYWLKSEYIKDTGSGQYAVKFYYAPDSISEPSVWTQLGTTVTGTSIGNLRNSSTALLVGGIYAGTSGMFNGTIYQVLVRDGVGGVIVFDANFSAEPVGTISFTEDSTNAATVTLTTTYGQSSQNDVDILAMRPHPTHGPLWHFGNTYDSGNGDTLNVSGLTAQTYDYVVHKINPSTGSVNSSTRVNGTTSVTELTLSSDNFGGNTVLAVEVMTDGGTPGTPPTPGANAVAYFLPSTINASATIGTDTYGKTWTLTRPWPSGGTYSPSQVIDKPCIHMYESSPRIVKGVNSVHSFNFEHWKSFSVLLHLKRVWTGVEGTDVYQIFNVDYGNGAGLRVFYDGPKIKATYSDGVSTEAVEWVEVPSFGVWHRVVIRRNGTIFSMVVDGDTDNESTTDFALSVPFPNGAPEKYFSEVGVNPWNARFALANFSFFDRYLSNAEISLLESEI